MKKRAPKNIYVLFDATGVECGAFSTRKAAEEDARGPHFLSEFTIEKYTREPNPVKYVGGRQTKKTEAPKLQDNGHPIGCRCYPTCDPSW